MQKNIKSLVKGDFFSVKINILSEATELSCDLFSNRKYEDSLTIYNDCEREMVGHIYSTNYRVRVNNNEINGKNHKLSFYIDTVNVNDNESIMGEFQIITDVGELVIPYKYNVSDDDDTKTIKNLNNIEDYYKLAVDNIKLALAIFDSKNIYKSKMMYDENVITYYETMKKGASKYVSFIEFFLAFGYDVKSCLADIEDQALNNYLNVSIKKSISIENNAIKENNNEKIYDLIERIQDKDFINSLAISYIRKGCHDDIVFHILSKALSYGFTINNLYQAILESLPHEYDKKLPLYVYRYFYEDRSFTFEQKIRLYENVINAFDETDDIYKMYYDEIKQFALSEIYQNKISESLVKLYKSILKVDIINKDNASNILYLVRNYKLTLNDGNIKYAIIKYKETKNETKYEINNGICYLPVFFDSYVLLFEDIYGNVLYNVDYELKVLFDNKDIEGACLSICQDNNLFYFSKFIDIKEKNELSNIDIAMYFEICNNLSLNLASKLNINKKIIDYLFNKALKTNRITTDEMIYIEKIDFNLLDIQDKKKILKIMLQVDNLKYVYKFILKYNIEYLNDDDKALFYEKSINTNQIYIDDIFLHLVYSYVINNNKTLLLISYLNDNFIGSIKNLYKLLVLSKSQNIETFTLSKRLMNIMYDMCSVDIIDDVFSYYDYNADYDKEMVLAYLTCKSYEYFCYNKNLSQKYIDLLIEYLLNNVDKLDTLPIIYILSFTKYVSTLPILYNNDVRRLLISSMNILMAKDLVFAYYKKLNKHIRINEYIMNKEYIEYHTDYDFIPRAKIRINNSKVEKDIELVNVYRNIYIKSLYVYKNEVITYKIYNSTNIEKGVLQEGSLSYNNNDMLYQPKLSTSKSTYDYINEIITNFDDNNFNKTKQSIIDFRVKQEVTKDLFNI